jgi:hypothetical protein
LDGGVECRLSVERRKTSLHRMGVMALPIIDDRRRSSARAARTAQAAVTGLRTPVAALGVLVGSCLFGCQAPGKGSGADAARVINERHARLFGDAELPRRIGVVENVGLQVPLVSPDGRQMLYLRTDQDYLSPMTLLGSPNAQRTPPDGSLSIWIRPLEGAALGRRLSQQRWAHSPVWSDTGEAVAYVANEPPESWIVHVDLRTGQETLLGRPGMLNCLPRFDGNDQTLLFCAGEEAAGPSGVYRQAVGDAEPTALSPPGADCLFPVMSDGRENVLCAEVSGEHLNWVKCGPDGIATLASQCSLSARPAVLQTWAGVASPLSPDRDGVLFYDAARDRVCVLHVAERIVRQHRRGSIAACWLDEQTIALAIPDGAFVVNTTTGMSVSLFNGQWVPCRYVAATRRLVLLGRDTSRRFAIWEVTFKPLAKPEETETSPVRRDELFAQSRPERHAMARATEPK